jgi:hypothetical protein
MRRLHVAVALAAPPARTNFRGVGAGLHRRALHGKDTSAPL